MAIGLDVIAMLAFFAIVGVILLIDRKNLEFLGKVIIFRRWKRGQYVMDKWIFSHRKFLEIVGVVGVVLGFVAMIGGLFLMIYFTTLNQQAGALLLPTAGDFKYPAGFIGVPFWFWLVSVFVVLTVHEPMHAIFARLAGVRVNSWGLMTLLVLPIGAFVDPDMKKVSKLRLSQKLKIFAGGSLGNFAFGAVAFGVITAMTVGLFSPSGVAFASTVNATPAHYAGLQGTITSIDGDEIRTFQDLNSTLHRIPPDTEIDIETSEGNHTLTTKSPPSGVEGSYIGISGPVTVLDVNQNAQQYKDVILIMRELFLWLFIFNIGIGIFNMLPAKPFDGGHMFEAILAKLLNSDKMARTAINITSLIVFGIILFNVFGTNIIKALI